MNKLMDWARRRSREAARRRARAIAERMRATLSGASVEVIEGEVAVSGKGLLGRWMIDPELRFLARDGR